MRRLLERGALGNSDREFLSCRSMRNESPLGHAKNCRRHLIAEDIFRVGSHAAAIEKASKKRIAARHQSQ